jgi:hypothetical protein
VAPWAGRPVSAPTDPAGIVEQRLAEARELLTAAHQGGDLRGWATIAKAEAELAVQLQVLRPPVVDPDHDPADQAAMAELLKRFEVALEREEAAQ